MNQCQILLLRPHHKVLTEVLETWKFATYMSRCVTHRKYWKKNIRVTFLMCFNFMKCILWASIFLSLIANVSRRTTIVFKRYEKSLIIGHELAWLTLGICYDVLRLNEMWNLIILKLKLWILKTITSSVFISTQDEQRAFLRKGSFRVKPLGADHKTFQLIYPGEILSTIYPSEMSPGVMRQ